MRALAGRGAGGVGVGVAIVGALVSRSALSGGLVTRGARPPQVDIETAWILWDPEQHRQDLLVSAQFGEQVEPFAWVLPLPSKAEVAPVEADLRLALPKLITAYQRRTPKWQMPSRASKGPLGSLVFGEQGKVEWEQVDAGREDALSRLLGAPLLRKDVALEEWLARYAREGWSLVGVRPQAAVSPFVRLTFKSERPFYPYREPARGGDTRSTGIGRVLRITVIAPESVAWRLGPSVPTLGPAWVSFEVTHDDLESAFGGELHKALFADNKRYWLTSFEDWHAIRPGDDDLTFAERGPLPWIGERGTVGDKSGKGLELEPMSAPEAEQEVTTGAERGGARVKGMGPKRSKGARGTALAFGALALLAIGAWGWLHKQR